jgi:signal transduction histidine kinase
MGSPGCRSLDSLGSLTTFRTEGTHGFAVLEDTCTESRQFRRRSGVVALEKCPRIRAKRKMRVPDLPSESPLLRGTAVSTTRGIRHRLLTILVLGVLTSALTLAALVQLLSTTTKQRVERVHDGVAEEVDKIAKNPASVEEPYTTWIGMRGGTWTDAHGPSVAPPAGWEEAMQRAVRASRESNERVVTETPAGDATLVMAAEPSAPGAPGAELSAPPLTAWAGFMVRPMPSLLVWQWIVITLAAATVLLVATTAYAIVTVNRGAAALRTSLGALASDLSAPIPRPKLRELSDVADGIARLAENLKRAHAEEERLGQELSQQERLAALGRVVAGVAHEVRNPLASIKLRLDLASTGGTLPLPAEKAIAHAASEIMRLDRLVADLLVVAGRSTGPRVATSLGALARARVEALSPWSAERGVTVTVSGDATAPVHADAIARAIDNLLRNAIDASARGDTVAIAIRAPRSDVASLRVEDRGKGVAPERVTELFEPFFTTKSEGTGLGLAISRAIARQHGGDLTYARAGEVTCFELVVGARPHANEASPPKVVAA